MQQSKDTKRAPVPDKAVRQFAVPFAKLLHMLADLVATAPDEQALRKVAGYIANASNEIPRWLGDLGAKVPDEELRDLADLANVPEERQLADLPQVPPDDVLRDLAKLANVPDKEQDDFFSDVRSYVQKAWKLDELFKKGGLAPKKGTALRKAALDLYDAVGSLNEDEREFIARVFDSKSAKFFDRISSGGVEGLREIADQIITLSNFAIHWRQAPRARKRGKPPVPVKNPIFQDFVFDLVRSAGLAGGNLEYTKNAPGMPLVKAIRMLEPYLPDGFVPPKNMLPKSILQRIKTEYNKVNAQLDAIEARDAELDALENNKKPPRKSAAAKPARGPRRPRSTIRPVGTKNRG
jgi:hypothetical protein